ncbi:MAG: hypothetical protein KDC46_09350 [Thermoleophilia bacterium]|nr:hypothetical protein [Thermoleophilia bacterium]
MSTNFREVQRSTGYLCVRNCFDFASTVSAQRQGRHVLGAREYRGGSYFHTIDDAQAVLDAVHNGQATVLGNKPNGNLVVRYDGVTGYNVNLSAGYPSQATNVFFIKGTSSTSVVPYNPAWKG